MGKTTIVVVTTLVTSMAMAASSSKVASIISGGKSDTPIISVVGGFSDPKTASDKKPVPAPTPTPAGGVPSPSLDGLAPVASGINIADYLMRSWGTGDLPGLEPGQVEGAFRFLCAPGKLAYDDPIVYPGQPGRSHLHQFFGNTKADANSTYQSLRTSGESTCNNLLNRSAYWIPAMMNGRGKAVMPDWVSIYYKRPASNLPECTTAARACVPLPRGLRYVFGYNMTDPAASAPITERWFNCDGPGAVSGKFANIVQAAKNCPVGARLGVVLNAPNCWNGTELDSADHRSHMAYMEWRQDGKEHCPATHPYIVPRFTLGAWYTTDATLDRSGNESADVPTWYLASDRMAGMANAVPGSTLHADWFGAWEDSIMDLWMKNCIEKMLSCSGGDLGQRQQIKTTAGYSYGNFTQVVDLPAR